MTRDKKPPARADRESDSISGSSAAHFINSDDSFAQSLQHYRISIRDFVVLSFLTDQGAMSVNQLARTLNVDNERIVRSVGRLQAAALLDATNEDVERPGTKLAPSDQGKKIADRIINGI